MAEEIIPPAAPAAAAAAAAPPPDPGPPTPPPTPLSTGGQAALGLYWFILAVTLAYFVAKVWPAVPGAPDQVVLPTSNQQKGTTPTNQSAAPQGKPAATQPATTLPATTTTTQPPATQADANASDAKQKDGKGAPPPTRTVSLFGDRFQFSMDSEVRLILIVLAVGALGGCISCALSFVAFVGNRKMYSSWTWYYVLMPPISAGVALMVYFALRGGFFSPGSGTSAVNDFGVAAVAGLAGMFSKEATAKLKQIFVGFFGKDPHADLKDKVDSGA